MKDEVDSWMKKMIYQVAISLFIFTLCLLGIIVALYFFVAFISVKLAEFIKTVPTYQATLFSIVGVALAYIYRKYK